MTIFLAIVAVISGLIGLLYVLTGPGFIVPIWWILTLLSLVGIAALNLLHRIARATEKVSAEVTAQVSIRQKSPPPTP